MIYLVQLEPYEERYTEQWSRWIPEQMSELGIKYQIVKGRSLRGAIARGRVLDVTGTNYYKATQLEELCVLTDYGKITSEDVLFFYDLWFPGIEMLPYMFQQMNIRPKIAGVMHAGTYDVNDFTFHAGMKYWGKELENSWLKFIDYIFVGSEYHKRLLLDKREVDARKVYVTRLPYNSHEIKGRGAFQSKGQVIIFPHRTDEEKGVDEFKFLMKKNNWQYRIPMEEGLSKGDYYKLLGQSRIVFSSAKQETFGYGTLEAVTLGCKPVVPDGLSYKEMYPIRYRYRSLAEAEQLIWELMNEPDAMEELKIIKESDNAVKEMLEILQ